MSTEGGSWSRRGFLAATGASVSTLALGGAYWGFKHGRRAQAPIPGEIVGHAAARGHRLRSGGFSLPDQTIETDVLVVGGGIAGLTAARELTRAGIQDFRLLELEDEAGGNSVSGQNEISGYPWGAHYLPLPSAESTEVRELLRELGVLEKGSGDHAGDYREDMLCGDPAERLWIYGSWQEGLVPKVGLTREDRAQMDAFFGEMERLRKTMGRDGRRAFAIPLERSSRDPEWASLDTIYFSDYLARKQWNSKPLRWYLDYCCRDDYGAAADRVSAWAGIHYFASRPTGGALLTWPRGNGWIARKLAEPLGDRVLPQQLVYELKEELGKVSACAWDFSGGRSVRYRARAVILAVPRLVANRLLGQNSALLPEYAPWMVANVSVSQAPRHIGQHDLAWDTVSYHSRSLGYVHARHQDLAREASRTVITHYWPLDDEAPRAARARALSKSHADWAQGVVDDLEKVHPSIREGIQRIDVRLWGHAMPIPAPGWITRCRAEMRATSQRVFLAHSDRSGLSLFEQAHFQGTRAARGAIQLLGTHRGF